MSLNACKNSDESRYICSFSTSAVIVGSRVDVTTISALEGSPLQRVLLAGVSATPADALQCCSTWGRDAPSHNRNSLKSFKSVRLIAETVQEMHLQGGYDWCKDCGCSRCDSSRSGRNDNQTEDHRLRNPLHKQQQKGLKQAHGMMRL